MPRSKRVQRARGWYHVFNRGAARREIFLSDSDRYKFLDLLAEVCERFHCEIHAYCLMGNHYHLILYTHEKNLAEIMHYLVGNYTRKFNLRHGLDGPLFRKRYNAIPIEEDFYLFTLSRYIHRNPLAANMVENLANYRWSSYTVYLDLFQRPSWLYTDTLLSIFYNTPQLKKYSNYEQFVLDEDISESIEFGSIKYVNALDGTEPHFQVLLNKIGAAQQRQFDDYREIAESKLTLDEVLSCCADYFDVTVESIVHMKHSKKNLPRAAVMYICYKLFALPQGEIARRLNTSRTSVSMAIKRFECNSVELAQELKKHFLRMNVESR